jgi:uncharacterized protein (DUF1015 family)
MAIVKPFPALRPKPDLAARICELPYDVMSTEEARQIAAGNPLSFLHVSKPEIDLPPSCDIHSPPVYAKAKENFHRLISEGALRQDPQPCFYLYRQVMGNHSQVGLVGAASCENYLQGVVKKHELTRPDKEDDRVRHMEILNSQTGPVFLVYRASAVMKKLLEEKKSKPPEIDFIAADGVRHSSWTVGDPASVQQIEAEFARCGGLYIADGHHRSAAAARVYQSRKGAGQSGFFLGVIFPDDQVQILPYNRVLKDLNGVTPTEMIKRLERVFVIEPGSAGAPRLARKHELGLYVLGRWHRVAFRPELVNTGNPIEDLDVTLLQRHVLAPIFGINDPRTSKRINFIGGIRGTPELEKVVNGDEFACAFSMFPTSIADLMSIADAGGIMPPKSTWFEPKLRDGMFCHMIQA